MPGMWCIWGCIVEIHKVWRIHRPIWVLIVCCVIVQLVDSFVAGRIVIVRFNGTFVVLDGSIGYNRIGLFMFKRRIVEVVRMGGCDYVLISTVWIMCILIVAIVFEGP